MKYRDISDMNARRVIHSLAAPDTKDLNSIDIIALLGSEISKLKEEIKRFNDPDGFWDEDNESQESLEDCASGGSLYPTEVLAYRILWRKWVVHFPGVNQGHEDDELGTTRIFDTKHEAEIAIDEHKATFGVA